MTQASKKGGKSEIEKQNCIQRLAICWHLLLTFFKILAECFVSICCFCLSYCLSFYENAFKLEELESGNKAVHKTQLCYDEAATAIS